MDPGTFFPLKPKAIIHSRKAWPVKNTRIISLSIILLGILLVPLATHNTFAAQSATLQPRLPKVMTYNIYQGTELLDVITATTPTQFVLGVATDYGHQVANNFPERAQAIASEIVATGPDLVGLQEVALWRTGPHTSPPTQATSVAFDYLQILLDALTAHGASYSVLVLRNNFDVQGPGLFPTGLLDVRLTDRSAILVRTSDLSIQGLTFINKQSQDYTTNTIIATLAGPVTLLGGYESVDVAVFGFAVARFISTHLDGFSQTVRDAQAQQLINGPVNTKIPVIMSGDLNSAPGSSTYNLFTTAQLTDSWTLLNPNNLGLTCCQVNQNGVTVDIINNPTSFLATRVDMVFTRAIFQATSAILVGADSSTRTTSGLWPSDHAGLVVTLGFVQQDS
jgi:endonuclease/exonuclease/phosphatase family metal-dependent hydrolase